MLKISSLRKSVNDDTHEDLFKPHCASNAHQSENSPTKHLPKTILQQQSRKSLPLSLQRQQTDKHFQQQFTLSPLRIHHRRASKTSIKDIPEVTAKKEKSLGRILQMDDEDMGDNNNNNSKNNNGSNDMPDANKQNHPYQLVFFFLAQVFFGCGYIAKHKLEDSTADKQDFTLDMKVTLLSISSMILGFLGLLIWYIYLFRHKTNPYQQVVARMNQPKSSALIMIWFIFSEVTLMESFALKPSLNASWMISCIVLQITYIQSVTPFIITPQSSSSSSSSKLLSTIYLIISIVYIIIRFQFIISWDWFSCIFSIFISIVLFFHDANNYRKNNTQQQNQQSIDQTKKMMSSTAKAQALNDLYYEILGLIPEGVAIFDKSKHMIFANKTIKDLFKSNKRTLEHILMSLSTDQQQNVFNNLGSQVNIPNTNSSNPNSNTHNNNANQNNNNNNDKNNLDNNNKSATQSSSCLNPPENIIPSPSRPSDIRLEAPIQFQFFKSMQSHTYLQDNCPNTPNQLDVTDHSSELQPEINSSRPLCARDNSNKLLQAISQSQQSSTLKAEVDSPQFLFAEEGMRQTNQENYSNMRPITDIKKVIGNQNAINNTSNATFAKPAAGKEISSPLNSQVPTITTLPNNTNTNNYTSPISNVNSSSAQQQCNFFAAYQKTNNNTDTDGGINTLTNTINTQGQFLNSNVYNNNPGFNSNSSLHFPFQTQHHLIHHPQHTIMLNRLPEDNDGSSSLTKSPYLCSCNINSTNINSNNISSSSNINIQQNLIGTSINNYYCGHSGQFTERNLLDQQQQQSYVDIPAVAVGSPGGNTQQVTGYFRQHSPRKRCVVGGNQDSEHLQGNQICNLISNNHMNNLSSPEHAQLQQAQQPSYRQSSIQKRHQKMASLRPESEEQHRGSEIDMGCYFSKLGYFQDNASFQPGKSHNRLFKKRLLSDKKTTEIIQGETKVSDILKDLFGERDKEMKLDVPGASSTQTQPAESNIGVGGTSQRRNSLQRDDFAKSKTLFSQLNNPKNAALGYMQFQEDMMKVQVRWKDEIFVLKFLLFEIETAENHTEEFILILVDPLWQEYYNKRMEEVEKYKMKMFASLSHELRTPLNCTISMLEGLEQFIQDPSIIEDYLYPALHSQKLLLNQINDILDFAQIDSGKFKYSFVDFDLMKLLEDCQTLMQLQANVKSLTLELLYDPRLAAIVKSDPNRIRQILLNFLSNSLKFTPEGGKITISAEPVYSFETDNQQKYIRLSVKDTGMGMKPETLSNIFHAFNKTEYEKEGVNAQGCGLGLVISQSISRGLCCTSSQNNISSSNLVATLPAGEFLLPPASQGIQVESVYQHGSNFSFVIQDMDPKQLLIPGQSNEKIANKSNRQNYQQQTLNENTLNNNDESFSQSSVSMSSNENSRPLDMIKEEPTSLSTKLAKDIPDNEEHQQDQVLRDSCNVQNESIPDGPPRYSQPQETLEANFIEAQKLKEQENLESQESPRCSQKKQTSISKSQANLAFPTHGIPSYSNNSTSPGQTTTQIGNHATANNLDREQSSLSIAVGVSNLQSQKGQSHSPKDRADQHVQDLSKERLFVGGVTFSADPTAEIDGNNNMLTHGARSQLAPSQGLLFTQSSQPTPNSTQQHLLNSELIAFRNSTFTSSKLTSNLSRTLTNKSFSKMISAQGFTGYHSKMNITEDLTVKILSAMQTYLEGSVCCDHKCAPILIADDNQFNVLALSRVLQIFASTPMDKAFDGNQTYQKIIDRYSSNKDDPKKCKACRKYALIFMDIEMPFMTGYEVIKKSLKFFKDHNIDQADLPYVIACTAHSADQEQIKAKIAGFDDYISKPIMKNDLQKLLCDWFYNQHYQNAHNNHKHQSLSQNPPIAGQGGGLKSIGQISTNPQLSYVALDK